MAQGVELATGYVSLTVDGSRLSSGIRDATNRAGGTAQKSGDGIGSKLASGMGKALKVGAIATGGIVAGALGTALVSGFKRLNAIDEAKKKLAGLGNSAQDVEKIMKNASASVKGTAFGLGEAATSAAGAVAAGVKPGKELQRTLSLTADAASIAGVSMGQMGSIFNKVATSNKIQGDVIAQLSDAGIPVVQLLAKELGKSSEETVKLASAGKINFKTFQNAMEKGLGGAAQKSGDTVNGAIANAKASLGRIGANLLGGIFPKIAPLVKKLTAAMGPLEEAASGLGDKIGSGLTKAFDLVGAALGRVDWKAIGATIGDVTGKAKQIIDVLFKGDFKGGPFEEDSPVINFFFNLRDAIGNIVDATIKPFKQAISDLKDQFSIGDWEFQDGAGFGGFLYNIGVAVHNVVDVVKGVDWGAIFGGVVSAAKSIGGDVANVFQLLLPHLKTFASGMLQVGKDIGPLVVAVGKTLVAAFQAVKPYLIAVGAILAGAFVVALKVIPPILHTVVKALTGLFNIIRPIMPILAGAAAGFLAFKLATMAWSAATKIAAAVSRAFAIAQALVSAAMNANPIMLVVIAVAALAAGLILAYKKSETFRNIVNGAFGAVKTVVMGVINWFKGDFVNFFTKTIPNTFQSVLDFVKNHWKLILGLITGPIGAAVILVISNWDKIKGAFSAAWDWVKGTFKGLWNGFKGILTGPIDGAKAFIHTRIENIKSNFSAAWNWVTGTFRNLWNGFKSLLTGPVDSAKSFIHTRIENIKTNFSNMWTWATGTFRKIWSGFKGILTAPIGLVRGFIDKEIAGWKALFTGAVSGIGKIWDGLKSVIVSPINGVISVINKFASGIENLVNKIPGVNIKLGSIAQIGVGSTSVRHGGGGHVAPLRAGMARGGILAGFTPVSRGDDQMVPMRSGEGVIVSEALRDPRSRSMIHAINHAALRGGSSLSSMFGGGYAGGGIIGDIGGAVVGGIKNLGSILTNPLKWLKDKLLNATLNKLGNSLPGVMTKGLLTSATSKIADLVSGSGGGGTAVGGSGSGAPGSGWKWQWNLIHRMFPGVSLTSAYRPGAHTAGSGALSYHALGRAIDLGGPVSMLKQVGLWIAQNYGAKSHDLLYTPLWGNMGLYNGAWYPQAANTVAQHRNHVHWGYDQGGIVAPYRPPVFDQGGTLAPGINVVNNKLGRPEPLVRAEAAGERPIHIEVNGVPMDQAQNVAKELAFKIRQGGMGKLAGAF